jgi:nitrogen fixation-related uncharacterized protein
MYVPLAPVNIVVVVVGDVWSFCSHQYEHNEGSEERPEPK